MSEFDTRPALVRKHKRVELIEMVFHAFLSAALVMVLIVVVLDIRIAHEQRDRIFDCTVPEGQCFQESQERTAEAVEAIVKGTLRGGADLHQLTRRVAVAANACADKAHRQTIEQIEACIKREMRQDD